ncbi:MAG: PP2C family protein-serine/threonine phosphatase, partial [Candidatus Rifleibacteriota bacterium]
KSKYRSERVKIEPGDKILMYTDGLVEATVSDQKMIGYEKAREWFSQAVGLNAEESVTMMFQRFNSATEGRAAEDDISLIVIHRHA